MRPCPLLDPSAAFGVLSPFSLATRWPPQFPSRLHPSYSHACASPFDAYPLYSASVPFPPFPHHLPALLFGASPLIVRVVFSSSFLSHSSVDAVFRMDLSDISFRLASDFGHFL